MPAGVTWTTYLKFTVSGLLAMAAGAQLVHTFYHPLDDLREMTDKEYERLKAKRDKPPDKS